MWKRWTTEYLRALRERYCLKHHGTVSELSRRCTDVVIIKSTERNRNCWTLVVIENLIVGKGGVLRAARVRTSKSILERAIQQLYIPFRDIVRSYMPSREPTSEP